MGWKRKRYSKMRIEKVHPVTYVNRLMQNFMLNEKCLVERSVRMASL